MDELDQKINDHFAGLVVRKDLVKAVKGNAIVPTYVLEYLLGQYCATNDEATIQTGIATVKKILLKHSDLFEELPEKFYDSAFLDRLHFYLPGWEVDIIRGEMFSAGYGFVVDYLAEILRSLRDHDYSDRYQGLFSLSSDISTRDRDGIHKTFSGLMKILFPHGDASAREVEELFRLSIEGRKRVKDQLMRIDSTYAEVAFNYQDEAGQVHAVATLEEDEYPHHYHGTIAEGDEDASKLGAEAAESIGIKLTWEFDQTGSIHARHIVTDTGWKILLDRGLDIFQHYEMNEAFAFANRMQQCRSCKAFEVTYIR